MIALVSAGHDQPQMSQVLTGPMKPMPSASLAFRLIVGPSSLVSEPLWTSRWPSGSSKTFAQNAMAHQSDRPQGEHRSLEGSSADGVRRPVRRWPVV